MFSDTSLKDTIGAELALKPGKSVDKVQYAYDNFNVPVCFKLELKNYTAFNLTAKEPYASTEYVVDRLTSVKPGEYELIAGRKKRSAIRGLECVFTWNIGDTGKILSVMFYLPPSVRIGSNVNQLAVGIQDKPECDELAAKEKLKLMYDKKDTNFRSKPFNSDLESIKHTDEDKRFSVVGVMGKEQKSRIVIILTASKTEEHSITGKQTSLCTTTISILDYTHNAEL